MGGDLSAGVDGVKTEFVLELPGVAVVTEQKWQSSVVEWPVLADFRSFDAVKVVATLDV
jgi:hypothetical protein